MHCLVNTVYIITHDNRNVVIDRNNSTPAKNKHTVMRRRACFSNVYIRFPSDV